MSEYSAFDCPKCKHTDSVVWDSEHKLMICRNDKCKAAYSYCDDCDNIEWNCTCEGDR